MRPYRFPVLFRKLYKEGIFRLDNSENKIYLTFDDGPTPEVTEQIIDILNKEEVPALFFVLGRNVKAYPLQFSLLKEKGFEVANHGDEHLNGILTQNTRYFSDARNGSLLSESNIFRPAYGALKLSQYRELKKDFKIVLWDIMPFDFSEKLSSNKMLGAIDKRIRSGSIIVLHDNKKSKAPEILSDLIKLCRLKGFSFGNLIKDINMTA